MKEWWNWCVLMSLWGLNKPEVRRSRPTQWLRSYSRCLLWGSRSRPRRHTERTRRLPCFSDPTEPLHSEGGFGGTSRTSFSHTYSSPCCMCSPEGSSARGRRSRPPDEERNKDSCDVWHLRVYIISGFTDTFIQNPLKREHMWRSVTCGRWLRWMEKNKN